MFNRLTYFYVTSTITFEYFQYFNFEKKKKKLRNEIFPSRKYHTVFYMKLQKLNTQYFYTNRMEQAKWTYYKEWVFASNYFFFSGNFIPV